VDTTITFQQVIWAQESEGGSWQQLSASNTAHTRHVTCDLGSEWCDDVTLLHSKHITYWAYRIQLAVLAFPESAQLRDCRFIFSVVNESYTVFELWCRVGFLLVTAAWLVIYARKMTGHRWGDWAIEQRWIGVLLLGLLAYNNPFYALSVLMSGWFPVFLNQFLLSSFLFVLLLFWLVIFDAFRKKTPLARSYKRFYAPKVALMLVFWILAIAIYTWTQLYTSDDPGSALNEIPGYLVMYVVMLLVVLAYVCWLLFLIIKAGSALKESAKQVSPHSDGAEPATPTGVTHTLTRTFVTTLAYIDPDKDIALRLTFLATFTVLILIATIIGVVFGYVGPTSNNAAQFLAFLALFNLYIHVLTFAYWPARIDLTALAMQHYAAPDEDEEARRRAKAQEDGEIKISFRTDVDLDD
jgi:hypothetical protein